MAGGDTAAKGSAAKTAAKTRRRIRARYQGEIDGKRSGMTQNINRAAPQRWQGQSIADAA
jgi:hypothetical protein